MTNNKTLKTIVFSLGLAAMTLSANNLNAQNGGGLFGRGDNPEYSNRDGETSFTVNTQDFGNDAPLGSGVVILLAAGAGYAVFKRKEEQQ